MVLPHGVPWHDDEFTTGSPTNQPSSPNREVAKLVLAVQPQLGMSAGHKRTSSMRDANENGSRMVQLQEADSTVADPNPVQEESAAVTELNAREAQELLSSKLRPRKLSDSIDDDADVLKALMGPYQASQLLPSDRLCASIGCCSSKPAGDGTSNHNGGSGGGGNVRQTCEQQEQACIMEEMREEKEGEREEIGLEYDGKQVARMSEEEEEEEEEGEDVHMQSEERIEPIEHGEGR